jgi:leader peptidase (prepilin peptidase) / N-methyltransferase
MPQWFVLGAAAAYGLVLGSFLNVVIHRLPRGMSLARPPSHCPSCGAPVRWFDNLPVLSWFVLGGRCRSCRARISPRYPLVELASGALLPLAVWRFGLSSAGVEAAVLVLLLLPLGLIDVEHHLLPDRLTLPGVATGLVWSFAGGLVDWRDAVAGSLVGAGLLYAVIVLYRAIRGVEGMGLGDVKLLAMVGAFLGWEGALLTVCLGACGGAVVGVALIVSGRGRRDTELPFGTFLAAAALAVLFLGTPIMQALHWIPE